jgi:hypothetical protein
LQEKLELLITISSQGGPWEREDKTGSNTILSKK